LAIRLTAFVLPINGLVRLAQERFETGCANEGDASMIRTATLFARAALSCTLILLSGSLIVCGQRAAAQTGSTDTSSGGTEKKPDAAWVEQLTDVNPPKTRAAGKIHGMTFNLTRAELQQGVLSLRQGTGFFPDMEWKLFLFAQKVSDLEGHFLNIETEDIEGVKNQPHVYMSWKENGKDLPKTKTWTGGYVIKLKFGTVTNGKLPGEVYLCTPDMKRSYVSGTFEAIVK
jgi:hypothetical protein